jgi:hypothetical protein
MKKPAKTTKRRKRWSGWVVVASDGSFARGFPTAHAATLYRDTWHDRARIIRVREVGR